jgi:arginyl-tRNA synthetase
MDSLMNSVASVIQEAAETLFTSAVGVMEVVKSKDPAFGDYQCNSAMKLSKQLKMSPQVVAGKIVEEIKKRPEKIFESIEVAGPGFINIRLSPSFLVERLHKVETNPFGSTKTPQKVIIDFSSPNIAKEMHVGHLRSTIIGDCLSRVFEAKGHDVSRINHVGDWGTAFGMLLAHIILQPEYSIDKVTTYSLTDLMRLYRESKHRFDHDAEFRKAAQLHVVQLQSGNPESLAIWKSICDISRRAYEEIYSLLDVKITERGESFYNPFLAATVEELLQKGLVVSSDGAKCIFVEGFTNREGSPLPLMMQKSDGGYTYDTTDMAALFYRIRHEKAERIIYVTDSGQATHFQMVFKAGKEAGVVGNVRLDHVPFGLVLGPDGKKFRTRSGDTERLIDLLTAAITQAEDILKAKNPDWSKDEHKEIASILGIGAIKYADLSSHRMSDYVFSYDRMLRFEGNTAAFIMYSYVRAMSIQRRIGSSGSFCRALLHPAEIALAKSLCQFPEVIDDVIETLLPNRLTDYLYSLAEQFNQFFRDCRVEKDPRQNERLFLVNLTGKTLQKGLELLGIQVPEKM